VRSFFNKAGYARLLRGRDNFMKKAINKHTNRVIGCGWFLKEINITFPCELYYSRTIPKKDIYPILSQID